MLLSNFNQTLSWIIFTSFVSNTNNTSDFRVPYNNTVANDTSYFTPVISGGLGTQGTIEVLQAGTYYLNARYSTFDLVQPSLPTVDGTKFMRITATVNGVKRPRAAGAAKNCWNSFIKIPHTELICLLILMQNKFIAKAFKPFI